MRFKAPKTWSKTFRKVNNWNSSEDISLFQMGKEKCHELWQNTGCQSGFLESWMKSVLLGHFIQIFSPGCGNPAEPAVDKELVLPFHDHVHC